MVYNYQQGTDARRGSVTQFWAHLSYLLLGMVVTLFSLLIMAQGGR